MWCWLTRSVDSKRRTAAHRCAAGRAKSLGVADVRRTRLGAPEHLVEYCSTSAHHQVRQFDTPGAPALSSSVGRLSCRLGEALRDASTGCDRKHAIYERQFLRAVSTGHLFEIVLDDGKATAIETVEQGRRRLLTPELATVASPIIEIPSSPSRAKSSCQSSSPRNTSGRPRLSTHGGPAASPPRVL